MPIPACLHHGHHLALLTNLPLNRPNIPADCTQMYHRNCWPMDSFVANPSLLSCSTSKIATETQRHRDPRGNAKCKLQISKCKFTLLNFQFAFYNSPLCASVPLWLYYRIAQNANSFNLHFYHVAGKDRLYAFRRSRGNHVTHLQGDKPRDRLYQLRD